MAYPIFDIDITKPIPAISVSKEDTGVAVLLRRNTKPIDFFMETLPANRELKLKQLNQRIGKLTLVDTWKDERKDEPNTPDEPHQFPSLTIAICTRDRSQYLARCLEFLTQRVVDTRFAPSSQEILVVDNNPPDTQTRDVVSSFSNVRYVTEPKPGLNFARNRALEEAGGHLLAYVDDDVVVDTIWLSGLMEAWLENPHAAAFTGLVLPYELDTEAQILFEQRGGFRRGFDKIRFGKVLPGHSLYPALPYIFGTGANMAFQRHALLELGGFDEAMDNAISLPSGGDLDIFYRIIRAGYSLTI